MNTFLIDGQFDEMKTNLAFPYLIIFKVDLYPKLT
jgi:hypothetical protein